MFNVKSMCLTRGCTIKINLLGFSKFVYHCFLETVRIFTVPNLSYLFGIISEFRLGAKIGDARLWERNLTKFDDF